MGAVPLVRPSTRRRPASVPRRGQDQAPQVLGRIPHERIDGRTEEDTAPYLVYLFNLAYERRFGKGESYREIKRKFNDLVLSMEGAVRERIEAAPDPLAAALAFARVGNYIDFGAMNSVDEDTFLSLFDDAALSDRDRETYASFRRACAGAERYFALQGGVSDRIHERLLHP